MITQLQLERFKAFDGHDPIDLSPLTIISGLNSSGKSSILHSLLLLKQTLIADARPEALALEGAYLHYSQLRELTFGLPQQGAASIGFMFKVKRGNKAGIIEIELRHKSLPHNSDRQGIVVNSFKCTTDSEADGLTLNLRNGVYLWPSDRPFSSPPPSNFKSLGSATINFDGFLPSSLSQKFTVQEDDKRSRTAEYQIPFGSATRSIDGFVSRLRTDLRQLRYLGPVRAVPKRAYVHYTPHYDLDSDGSNAAQVLWLRQSEQVKWGAAKKPLIEAVNDCLKMMGLSQTVSAKQFQRIVYQLRVPTIGDSEKMVTIADVGFGFSQLLPVILRGLLPPDNSLVLFEQPEIHLHPACAGRLADLFLHFMNSGKQVLVETHSTELINRLRLRIVETPAQAKKINIVFVLPPKEKKAGATLRQLVIDENGMPDDWPEGFCDESAKLTRAIIEARNKPKPQP